MRIIPDGTWKPHVTVSGHTVTFQIQDGPIKENGYNGCQVDELIAFTCELLQGLNKDLPARETSLAVTKLQEAQHWLDARTKDRETRGVEGTSQA